MGGKGSGGSRIGAGRKRQSQALGELTGSRRTRARAKSSQSNQTENQNSGNQNQGNQNVASAVTGEPKESIHDVHIPQPPGRLTLDQLVEWNALAPLAAKAGGLTEKTKWALVDLCKDRVLLADLEGDIERYGRLVAGASGNIVANPALTRHATLRGKIATAMLQFGLAPDGRALLPPPSQPTAGDPFAEFDAPGAGDGETRH